MNRRGLGIVGFNKARMKPIKNKKAFQYAHSFIILEKQEEKATYEVAGTWG
ncbi:MAG: hypothetical protein JRF33_16020 [Deltaproteobacteria bacterium]|nr:hypothetical protein [Deltaproteobacteria bacterium]